MDSAPDEFDPFEGYEEADLRANPNLKWHRYSSDVLPAWIADMDAPLCPAVRSAIDAALDGAGVAGSLAYPSDELVAEVGAAFCRRSAERHGWTPAPEGVRLVTDMVGAYTAVLDRLTAPGDGVVLQTPVYPPFLAQAEAMGRRVISQPGDVSSGEWRWSIEQVEAGIDERTKVFVLVNPHNPTGRMFRRDELEAVADLAERHDLVVVSDEIHAELVLGDAEHVPFASLGPETAPRTITLTSASKAFNLAGMRCGIAHYGSERLLDAGTRLPHPSTGEVSSLAMLAVLGAWRGGDEWLDAVRRSLEHRREMVRSFVEEHLPEVRYLPGEATFLAWLDCRDAGLGDDPAAFFESNALVALGSGLAYGPGGAGFARLNFATSTAILSEILERMVTALDLRRAAGR